MGVATFTEELTTPVVPAKKFFSALILDFDTLIPQLIPGAIKSIETIQGNGGPGTIKKLTFAQGDQSKYMKQRIDALDKENMIFCYTIIEGEPLKDTLESISYEVKYEDTPGGGCKIVTVSKYFPKPGVEFKDDGVEEGKAKGMALFKAVEAYLVANPEAYL